MNVPPVSGIRPIFENDWMNVAPAAANTMSQANAMFAPAPAATPLTAQTTGFSSCRIARTIGLYWRAHDLAEVGRRGVAVGHHFGEVLARAEGAADAREQYGAGRSVVRDGLQRGRAALRPSRVEAVQDVRAIERDLQHAVALLGLDVLVRHGRESYR